MKRVFLALGLFGVGLVFVGCATTTWNSRRSAPTPPAGPGPVSATELRLCTIDDLFAAEFEQAAQPPAVWLAERCRNPEDQTVEESAPSAMLIGDTWGD